MLCRQFSRQSAVRCTAPNLISNYAPGESTLPWYRPQKRSLQRRASIFSLCRCYMLKEPNFCIVKHHVPAIAGRSKLDFWSHCLTCVRAKASGPSGDAVGSVCRRLSPANKHVTVQQQNIDRCPWSSAPVRACPCLPAQAHSRPSRAVWRCCDAVRSAVNNHRPERRSS